MVGQALTRLAAPTVCDIYPHYFLPTLNSFTKFVFCSHQLIFGRKAGVQSVLDDGPVDLHQKGVRHSLVQRLLEILIGIHLDAQVLLHPDDGVDALHA